MTETIFKIILSIGSVKWLWDGAWFLWRNLYKSRVTLDLFIAYETTGDIEKVLEKFIFLFVRNETDRLIRVDSLVYEQRFWARVFGVRPKHRFVGSSINWKVEIKGAGQIKCGYQLGNLLDPFVPFFGV